MVKQTLTYEKAEFIRTAIEPEHYPVMRDLSGDILPEVAVAGRSNVGKSSLLNNLFRRKSLVKTSSIPGKTQAINFFSVDNTVGFVDLPGYGFAKVPLSIRKEWGPMVQRYLEGREQLKLLLLLFDIRRKPKEDDIEFIEWATHYKLPILLVLTKVDKVKRNERKRNTEKILEVFNYENLHYIHYSVKKSVGREGLVRAVSEAIEL